MTPFAERCGVHDAARRAACDALLARVREEGIEQIRVVWCDLHGQWRGKVLMPDALPAALIHGVGLVGTLLLKDTSDRTAFKVFEPGAAPDGFAGAANLQLLPDPARLLPLPWAPGQAWLPGQPWFADGRPVPQDCRRALQRAVAALADAGWSMRCGLEVEFHVWRVSDRAGAEPDAAAWPAPIPRLELLHPGYMLLSDRWADRCDEVLAIVRRTAQGLGLPLASLEVELGPSQFEAVFAPLDALAAADAMVAFRNGVQQALHRAGYLASFVGVPPFAEAMASGWHLHQSWVRPGGVNAFAADGDTGDGLSPLGREVLAGLLSHAGAALPFATPTAGGYARFRPNALAPLAARWGRDNRGAMLRVVGRGAATRIENRAGEPAANPYLYLASQIHAGLDGVRRALVPPLPTEAPYAPVTDGERLPSNLGQALDALAADPVIVQAMGEELVDTFVACKRQEQARMTAAEDAREWQRREYVGRL